MKKLLMLLTTICFINCLFAQGNVDRANIKTTIEILNKQMEKVFNANDMVVMAVFDTEDAEIRGSNYVVTGRKNVDNYWLSLKDRGRGWKLTVIEIGGTDDYIYQLGNSDLTYISNGKETKSVTNFVLIWKKQKEGSYKIFRDYLTDIEFNKPKK